MTQTSSSFLRQAGNKIDILGYEFSHLKTTFPTIKRQIPSKNDFSHDKMTDPALKSLIPGESDRFDGKSYTFMGKVTVSTERATKVPLPVILYRDLSFLYGEMLFVDVVMMGFEK